jgi:putative oxidoreductase
MNYSNTTNSDSVLKDVALLIVRVFIGFAMLSHGFPKLQMLLEGKSDFLIF